MYANVQNRYLYRSIMNSTTLKSSKKTTEDSIMLYTIAVVLLILWLLGLVTSYTIGGFIHILLVVAVIMVLVKLISGRGI